MDTYIDEEALQEKERAVETLELIADGCYNLERPSSKILPELVEVIKYIEERFNLLDLEEA